MNLIETLHHGTQILSDSPSTSPSLDAEVLLLFITGMTKENLISQRLTKINDLDYTKYLDVLKDRKKGIPVAYLTGKKEFYNLSFMVNKYVLIPRPDTETLVEKIAFELKGKHNLKILDVGTGSGCIIISLAKNLSNANHYFGSDNSARAIAVAEENAAKHKVKIKFMRSDLMRTTGTDYDVIIANLPYLPEITDASIKFEPKQALVADNKGLALYEKLFKQISESKNRPIVYLEFGHDQADQIKALAETFMPDCRVQVFRDLSGVPRFARIWQKLK